VFAGPHERAVHDEHVLDVLLGKDRRAGGHAAQDRDFERFGGAAGEAGCNPVRHCFCRLRRLQLDPPRRPSVAANPPRLFQAVEVVADPFVEAIPIAVRSLGSWAVARARGATPR